MRRASTVAAVIAAMALGRVISDAVPVSEVSQAPFERYAAVGESVQLRYAEVEVPEARVSRELEGISYVFIAGGVYVVVPVAITATEEPTNILGARLRDTEGVEYLPTGRDGCAESIGTQTGVPVWATVCFDVPAEAVPGMQLVISAGKPDTANDNDRDDQAVIDLGLTADDADNPEDRLLATIRGLQRPSLEPTS